MMIRRASLAPLTTGPPANTVSPADSALAVVLPPFFLTTVSLTIFQVQVVPSGDLITTSPPVTDWMVPRSNESVWNPFLLWNVAVPSTPPRRRIRPSAHRTRAAGAVAEPASVSAVFSWAPCTLDTGLAVVPPADTAARVMPPPTRKAAKVTPAPQRSLRFGDHAGPGSAASAGYPPSASGRYMLVIPARVGPGYGTSPRLSCTGAVSAPRVRCRRAWQYR